MIICKYSKGAPTVYTRDFNSTRGMQKNLQECTMLRVAAQKDLHFDLSSAPIDEKNWNQEQWRKKKPMNYFKALHILNMADTSAAKVEVFKERLVLMILMKKMQ